MKALDSGSTDTYSPSKIKGIVDSKKSGRKKSKGTLSSSVSQNAILPPLSVDTKQNNGFLQLSSNPFKKGLFGDLFGTQNPEGSLLGILYRARVQEHIHKKKNTKVFFVIHYYLHYY